jgi:hypothetical protein
LIPKAAEDYREFKLDYLGWLAVMGKNPYRQ